MDFNPHLDIRFDPLSQNFIYGSDVFGPRPELRRIDDIRFSLRDPHCSGPDPVYTIAMDVGRIQHREEIRRRRLLFGVVAYASGTLGNELVRSQGHIHAVSPICGSSTPELIEVWQGHAVVYMQESGDDNPGRCFAVKVNPGDKAVIPPGWVHYVVNADSRNVMVFGAWCVREYAFDYRSVRSHGGPAWFPLSDEREQLRWERNPAYTKSDIAQHGTCNYPELNVDRETSIYEQFSRDPESLQWISDPARVAHIWEKFEVCKSHGGSLA